ncbi:Hypothetical predicted protein [Olea europaea subsp. europaea]|uniref:Uncharacterized protein n=1 Tax=Olea europaea subsp. europaea TaxID=158383 RepID=A0A8S0Q712_OLEEU|nr:Hypothetical predicted protein [Olea europaea subsp. europaea]
MQNVRKTMQPISAATPWTAAGNSWPVEEKGQAVRLRVRPVAATGIFIEEMWNLRFFKEMHQIAKYAHVSEIAGILILSLVSVHI